MSENEENQEKEVEELQHNQNESTESETFINCAGHRQYLKSRLCEGEAIIRNFNPLKISMKNIS